MNKSIIKTAATLVVGLGITGFSVLEFLVRKKTPFVVLDSRENPPNFAEVKEKYPNIPIYTGGFLPEVIHAAHTIILSPGLPKDHPEILRSLAPNTEIIGDIELFAREIKAPLVAITGSNGKSTVTSLVGEMARLAGLDVGLGGNLGTPALSLLPTPEEQDHRDLYVVELSSFQLETTYSMRARVATVLNISPDHMDRYPTLESYMEAKLRILKGCERVVINREDAYLLKHMKETQYQLQGKPNISFGLDKPLQENYGLHEGYLMKGTQKLISRNDLQLFGQHNVANALAALALGESVNLPMEIMIKTLREFKGLPHRAERVRVLNGVSWINDSKGTNVGATIAALQGLSQDISGKWVLIAGGMAKKADFTELKTVIPKYCRAVILIGEAAAELKSLLKDQLTCLPANTMEEAVKLAQHEAKPGDGVLLSPACASFDMFKNFEERGDVFKTAVKNLK